jgi:hypothetical protein
MNALNWLFESAARLDRMGIAVTRVGLVVVLIWIGSLKVFHYEDEGIVPFVANSSFRNLFYRQPAGEYRRHMNRKGDAESLSPGAPHGLCSTHDDQINAELLALNVAGLTPAQAAAQGVSGVVATNGQVGNLQLTPSQETDLVNFLKILTDGYGPINAVSFP